LGLEEIRAQRNEQKKNPLQDEQLPQFGEVVASSLFNNYIIGNK
jgi:hypothetical protein